MLYQIQKNPPGAGQENPTGLQEKEYINLRDIYAFIIRHFWKISLCILVASALGVAHVLTSDSLFTAWARLVIDREAVQAFSPHAAVGDGSLDNAKVDSEIEFLKSERVAISVITSLGLTDDDEFQREGRTWPFLPQAWSKADPAENPPRSEFERLRRAVGVFGQNLSVRRVGQSYVIEISFTSADPDKAARIANATADAYIADQLETKRQAAKSGGNWLEMRIEELRKQLSTAAWAAQEFRTRNNIVDAGSRGLLDDQQLAELNSQLVLARARTAEAQARLERIDQILASGVPDAAVAEVLGSQVISGLRERYLNASNRLAELSSRYTENHPAVAQLSNEMAEYKRAIAVELRRIGEVYKSDAEVARVRESELKDELAKLIQYAATTKEKQIQAAEFDAVAQTYRRLFESYVQRAAETVQQESFPFTNARIISRATKPLGRSFPKTKLVFAMSVLAGGIIGLGLAVLAENLDRTVRTPRQVRREFDVGCLGLLPRLGGRRSKLIAAIRMLPAVLTRTSFRNRTPVGLREVEEHPFSAFTHTMRSVKIAIDTAVHLRQGRCLAVTSLTEKEGKSTVAGSLAKLCASSGSRTLLIEGDLRKASTGRALVPQAGKGLLDVLAATSLLGEIVITDEKLALDILPAANGAPVSNSSDYLGSDQMRQLIEAAREVYQTIIIDLPAMRTAPDARAVSPFVDSFIVVAEWGRTPVEVLREALHDLTALHASVLGVLINKVDIKSLRRQREATVTYYLQ